MYLLACAVENKRKGNGKWKRLAGYFPHVFLRNTCALHLPQCTFACPAINISLAVLSSSLWTALFRYLSPTLSFSSFLLVAAATTSGHKWRGKLWHFLFSVKFQLWTNMTTLSIGNPKPAILSLSLLCRAGNKAKNVIFLLFSLPLSISCSFYISLSFWHFRKRLKSLCSTFMGVGACTRAAVSFLARHGTATIRTKL